MVAPTTELFIRMDLSFREIAVTHRGRQGAITEAESITSAAAVSTFLAFLPLGNRYSFGC
jgi:hypothetical protein